MVVQGANNNVTVHIHQAPIAPGSEENTAVTNELIALRKLVYQQKKQLKFQNLKGDFTDEETGIKYVGKLLDGDLNGEVTEIHPNGKTY
jgi:hypothetical protein